MYRVRWVVLGIAHAAPQVYHPNTHFVCVDGERIVLVDCPTGTTTRLPRVGLDPLQVTDVVLTHFHPDHVLGLPELLASLWLLGRKVTLHIYGLEDTLSRLQRMMALFEWSSWPDFYPVAFHPLSDEGKALALETEHTSWFTFPVRHLLPALGVRVEMPQWGKVVAYTGDTAPCPSLEELAQGADVLFHEATGEMPGHSSPAQAAALAVRVGVRQLYLVHLDPKRKAQALTEARQIFAHTGIPEEFFQLTFP